MTKKKVEPKVARIYQKDDYYRMLDLKHNLHILHNGIFGRYETIEQAENFAKELGYTEILRPEHHEES